MLTLSTTTATAVDLEDVVVLLDMVEGQRVLEARAATAADRDAQRLTPSVLLRGEQLGYLAGRLVGEGDGNCRRVGRLGHFIKCSERSGRIRSLLSPSAETAVVCDTTAYLPSELIAAGEIHLVSLYAAVDGRQEREADIADYAEFYERLRASGGSATTSQPSVGDFASVYEPLLAEGREIVSIHISAGISGTFEAAGQARERLIDEGKGGERIRVFDSHSAAGAWASRHWRPPQRRGRWRRRCGAGARRKGARGAEDVVRDRHARVPAPRRAHRRRRGPGSARR